MLSLCMLWLVWMTTEPFGCSALHAIVVGKFDALWSHADESTENVKAAGKEGKKEDKEKKVIKKKK